jgi:hypothetical protein
VEAYDRVMLLNANVLSCHRVRVLVCGTVGAVLNRAVAVELLGCQSIRSIDKQHTSPSCP